MPEYFFHIRLDTGQCTHETARKTHIFATPPVLPNKAQLSKCSSSTDGERVSTDDPRGAKILIQSIDMIPAKHNTQHSTSSANGHESLDQSKTSDSLNKRILTSSDNTAIKARFQPSDIHETEAGWGVVRLFRETQETSGLYDGDNSNRAARHRLKTSSREFDSKYTAFKDDECTTLCILAVPSYMSPSDFLGWVGEKTREDVSHFRMIRTERANRYMVLMRFRSGRRARDWRKAWNGASFDAAEPETAHVVFVRCIEFMSEGDATKATSFPGMVDDPFAAPPTLTKPAPSKPPAPFQAKPVAPPTPSLVEMPTCPVCLERMDETTGLLTIQCQHVFHCSCLSKWRGSGCPVCRFTHDGLSGKRLYPDIADDPDTGPNECSICQSEANLWICLICGNIGCGRYDAAHAFMHWQRSGHTFSMDMTTQRIWDYASDAYVHRIVQNKLDGKLVEMPTSTSSAAPGGVERAAVAEYSGEEGDYVPREKADAIGREYTALLTSQLESQRLYFEEKVSLAADKASQASLAATQATEAASGALEELARLRDEHHTLADITLPSLERERDRATRRADRAQDMARSFERDLREERTVGEGLMERLRTLDADLAAARRDNDELREMNRDLQFFISSQEKIKEMGAELADGSVSLPDEEEQKKKAKGKKAKGKASK